MEGREKRPKFGTGVAAACHGKIIITTLPLNVGKRGFTRARVLFDVMLQSQCRTPGNKHRDAAEEDGRDRREESRAHELKRRRKAEKFPVPELMKRVTEGRENQGTTVSRGEEWEGGRKTFDFPRDLKRSSYHCSACDVEDGRRRDCVCTDQHLVLLLFHRLLLPHLLLLLPANPYSEMR
ncbi:hypothetical protein H6P81_014746 [Aristolochia fimbriata]|uniref:Uncharacterized protein n=1 Tax=Aristolochia fimbriata TaxID=158543 RepID=A0AAV7E4T5_ARIFI|nr:hypothetical protein H6P81_014746 [Aristolochia fimbriata]